MHYSTCFTPSGCSCSVSTASLLAPRFPEKWAKLQRNHSGVPCDAAFFTQHYIWKMICVACCLHSLLCPKAPGSCRREWGIKHTGGWGRALLILTDLLSLPFRLPCCGQSLITLIPAAVSQAGLSASSACSPWPVMLSKEHMVISQQFPESSVAPNCCIHSSMPRKFS